MRTFPVEVSARTTAVERKPRIDAVPRDAVLPYSGFWRGGLLEEAVTLRASREPDLFGNLRERAPDGAPLVGDVGAAKQERLLRSARELPVPGEDHPPFVAREAKDLLIRKTAGVRRVASYDAEVPGEATDHLVGDPSRYGHGPSEGSPGITLAIHIRRRECVARSPSMRLFGTNGIREVVGREFTSEFVTRVSDATASLLPTGSHVVLGWDGRTSSPAFARIVGASFALAGHKVTELGLLPTPAIQYNVPRLGADLGVVVTASHNPPEFNGLKCIASDGLEVARDFEERIEAAVERGVRSTVGFDRIGDVVHEPGGARRYLDGIRAQVDVARIGKRRFSLVLDCGNGASVPTSPALVRSLGCRGMTLNAHVDGTFPGHLSEPTAANLTDLQRAVPASGAEFGVAHDGDADRAVFVEASGRYVPGEEMLTLLARDAVERHPGSTVVIPVSASQSVEDAIRPFGGTVVYTRIGSPTVTREMKARGAVFGGEDNGGHVFPALHYARDGAMTLAAVLDLLARRETDLASLLKELPRYTVVKEKVGCPVALREQVVRRLVERFTADSEKVVTLDGVKAYRPGGWVLLRPSGTEPLFRVFAESKDPARARALADEGLAAVRAALEELGEKH